MDFKWDDPLLLEHQLDADERRVRDAARAFSQGRLAPRVVQAFRSERTDPVLFRELGGQGLLAPGLPRAYGGAGLGAVSQGLVARELERVDSGFRAMVDAHAALATLPILEFGTEAQKRRYLPRLARGDWVGCAGLAEPEAEAGTPPAADPASHPAAMRTRARRVKGGHRLSGVKTWVTNSPVADLLVVWARNDDGRIRGFLLERGCPGLSTPAILGKAGLRAAITGEIIMDEVFVPTENEFPQAGGLGGPFACLDAAHYRSAWGVLGAAEDCWARARQHALERVRFGRPLAASQLIQKKLSDMQTEIALALQACLRVGRMRDVGLAPAEVTALVRRNSHAKALDIARSARDMLGGNGLTEDCGVIRHVVNLEVVNSHEDIQDQPLPAPGQGRSTWQAFAA